MRFVIFFSLFILSSSLFGQKGSAVQLNDLDKKSYKSYNKVLKNIKEKKFDKATERLNDILIEYPNFIDGRSKLVSLNLKNQEKEKAIANLILISELQVVPEPKISMTLADLLEEKGDYSNALKSVEYLLYNGNLNTENTSKIKRRFEELKFREYAYSHPVDFKPIPLDSNINTNNSESLPTFNADGSVMVYTSMKMNPNRRMRHEDIFISYKNEKGKFSKGRSIASLNTIENEGAQTFSQDGKSIIFTACNRRDSYGGCDLYISFYRNGQWGKAFNMGPTINSRYSEKQPSLSADGKTIFFSSTRKGGFGKEDIWQVELQGSTWSEPQNLGPTINTSGNEGSPFIHPDSQTLYFRSDHHIGLGDYDLFLSRRDSSQWSKPQNLGFPINTKGNDGALFVELNGSKAYYTSDYSNQGHLDIIQFNLPVDLKPQTVGYLKIKVIDKDSGNPIKSKVILTHLDERNDQDLHYTDQKGEIITVIETGNLSINIEKEGYVFHSENININKDASIVTPFEYVVQLQKIKSEEKNDENNPVVLKNIFFQTGSATLLEKSYPEIETLSKMLRDNPNVSIKIIGHTDNVGTLSVNLILSEGRAKAVYDAIVNQGIDKNRLLYLGKGESEPLADNESQEGRSLNRRTEFILFP